MEDNTILKWDSKFVFGRARPRRTLTGFKKKNIRDRQSLSLPIFEFLES